MRKLIKNKQGASKFFEFLMLFPFCLYIVLLSLYKIVGMIAYDNLADYSFEITREAIVEKDLEYALNEMAKIAYNSPDFQILEIKITLSDDTYPKTVTFSKTGSSGSFISYCVSNNNEIEFDVANFKKSVESYEEISNMWRIGNIIHISTYQDLSTNLFKEMTTVSLPVPENGEWKRRDITLGLPTEVYATIKLPISNEKQVL